MGSIVGTGRDSGAGRRRGGFYTSQRYQGQPFPYGGMVAMDLLDTTNQVDLARRLAIELAKVDG